MLMAAARLNLPSVFLYGGSILPGHYKDQALDVVSVFEAVGACAAGTITENELGEIETARVPDRRLVRGHVHREHDGVDQRGDRAWRCPGSASAPAVDRRRDDFAYESGRAVMHLLELDLRPRQIMTKEAFENAIAITMALGGSTNAVLHLLAIANEARVELELDDFNRIGARVPHLADMKPHGKYHMVDLDRDRWRAGRDEDAPRRGPAARRLPHGDRQDDGREPRRPRSARARRRRRAPDVEPDPRAGRHRDRCAVRSRRRARS